MQVDSNPIDARELTKEEFEQEACLLAAQIVLQVLRPKAPVRTTVVLQALASLYRAHALSLPAEARHGCGLAIATLAGELMQEPKATQPAPVGALIY